MEAGRFGCAGFYGGASVCEIRAEAETLEVHMPTRHVGGPGDLWIFGTTLHRGGRQCSNAALVDWFKFDIINLQAVWYVLDGCWIRRRPRPSAFSVDQPLPRRTDPARRSAQQASTLRAVGAGISENSNERILRSFLARYRIKP
jgi:hypothetical protein